MKILTSMTLLLVTLTAAGQSPRDIGDEHALQNDINSLPPSKSIEIKKAVSTTLRHGDSQSDNYDPDEISDIVRNLSFERIGNLTLVQTFDSLSCGAVGNCSLFALDKNNRVLMSTRAYYLTVQTTLHHGFPDFQTGLHASGMETVQSWYRFDGHHYRAVRCADDYVDPFDSKWHRKFIACK